LYNQHQDIQHIVVIDVMRINPIRNSFPRNCRGEATRRGILGVKDLGSELPRPYAPLESNHLWDWPAPKERWNQTIFLCDLSRPYATMESNLLCNLSRLYATRM